MNERYTVEVVEHGTDKVVHTVERKSLRSAERVDDGMQHNLDHSRFYTRCVVAPPVDEKAQQG